MDFDRTQSALGGAESDGALGTYFRAIRAHWLLVALVTLVAIAGSVALMAVSGRQYEATATVLASPLPEDDETFLGLGLLQDTGDPTRTVQTAATLLESFDAAEVAANRLGPEWDAEQVLGATRVEPQGESNVVAVTANSEAPDEAADVANEFTEAALDTREQSLDQELSAAIEQIEASDDAGDTGRLSDLRELQARGTDPTLSLAQTAEVPTSPVGAPRWLIVAAALLAGLALGTLGAYAMESVNPRLREQDEVTALFPLDVLSGVPRLRRRERALSPLSSPAAVEAYRTLRMQLTVPGDGRAIMVTSGSSGDGKTTVAANLAYALIDAGKTVVLIDFDLRKPGLAQAVGARAERGLGAALSFKTDLSELLVESPNAPGLKVLPAAEGDAVMLEAITERFPDLLPEAKRLGDYVIIDTSPLGEVSDPLRLSKHVDEVLIVVRPRHTMRRSFQVMRDLLRRAGVEPAGFFVIGQSRRPTYYGYLTPQSENGAAARREPEASAQAATSARPLAH